MNKLLKFLLKHKTCEIRYGGGCFYGETLISTPKGKIPIKDIKIGDEVYCFSKSGDTHVRKVTEVFVHN